MISNILILNRNIHICSILKNPFLTFDENVHTSCIYMYVTSMANETVFTAESFPLPPINCEF